MKTTGKNLFFLLAMLFVSKFVFSQQFKPDPKIIINRGVSVLYSDHANLIVVESERDSIQTLVFKASQGVLQNFDSGIVNGLFHLHSLQNGKVMLSVFKQVSGALVMLNYKEFKVITRPLSPDEKRELSLDPKPVITVNGYKAGMVLLDSIRSATKFQINKPYKIKELTIYVGTYNGYNNPVVASLNSGDFDDHFKAIWSRLGKNCYVDLEKIIIEDDKKRMYKLTPVAFTTAKE